MPRILKRPMFRSGGSTNEGIMTGLVDRKGYAEDTGIDSRVVAPTPAEIYGKEYEDIFSKIKPPKPKFNLGQMGLNLVSGRYAGDGLLQNIAGSAEIPYAEFTKADDARGNIDYQTKMLATKMGISRAEAEAAVRAKAKKGYRILSPDEAQKILGQAYDSSKAYQLNLDDNKISPISGLGTTIHMGADQTEYSKIRDKQEADYFKTIQDKAIAAEANITNYELVGALSKNVNSGAYGELLLNVAKFGKRIGVNTDWITTLDENGITRLRDGVASAETMEVLQVQFALEKIQKTKGAISDKEFAKFIDTSPGLSMTPRGIELLTIVNKALGRRDIEEAELASQWEAENGRLNNVAETPYGKLTFKAFIAKWKEDPENRVVSEEFLKEMEEVSNQGSLDFDKGFYTINGIRYRKLKDGTVIRMGVAK